MPEPLRNWLDGLNAVKRDLAAKGFRYTPTTVREALDKITRRYVTQVPEIPCVRDDLIPGPGYPVPVRVYHPRPEQTLPVAVFVHGGGHVAGGVSLYDPIARKLAIATRRLLISVEYRLAPECPYPAALIDVMAVAKGAFSLLDTLGLAYEKRVALIGDSGGGTLCATLAHRCQFDPGLDIERQALIYPSLDYTLSLPSVTENGRGCFLERDRILWLFDCYLQSAEDRRAVSPLYMPLTSDYPPTLVLTAEYDPLRDEGMAYAQRLGEVDIACEAEVFEGMVHAFLNIEDLVPRQCSDLYGRLGQFFSR
jgi:acetyl esterase/lipase